MNAEDYIPVGQANQHIPGRPSRETIWRWINRGVRGGHRLETLLVGGRRFTTHEMIADFIERQNGPAIKRTTARKREAQIRRAEKELDEAGI